MFLIVLLDFFIPRGAIFKAFLSNLLEVLDKFLFISLLTLLEFNNVRELLIGLCNFVALGVFEGVLPWCSLW